jgi:hypothetical protein
MLQLTNGMAVASSGGYVVVPEQQQACINISPDQLQALLGNMQSSSTDSSVGTDPSCSWVWTPQQGDGTVLQTVPQVSSTDAAPVVVQMQGPADQSMHMQQVGPVLTAGMQQLGAGVSTSALQALQPGCVQQGYVQDPNQQMVLVQVASGTPQSQLATCAGTGDSDAVQVQMQQVQGAVQQLNSQTVAVTTNNTVSRLGGALQHCHHSCQSC